MLSGDCTISDRLLSAVAIIVLLKPHNCRNGCSVQERQAPTRRTFNCGFRRLLTTHREVAKQSSYRNIIIATYIVIFLHNLTIPIANFRGYLCMPHSGRQKSFDSIYQPNKVGVSVGNLDLRDTDRSSSTFWNSRDFQRKITEPMQISNLLRLECTGTECSIENSLVLCDNFLFWTIKEVIVKAFNEILLNKCL